MWQFRRGAGILRASRPLNIGLMLVGGLISPVAVGWGQEPASRTRGGFGMPRVPSLLAESRREDFVAKLKLTDEQKKQFDDLTAKRLEVIRNFPRPTSSSPPNLDALRDQIQATSKELEEKALNVLTPEQKAIWEVRAAEIKADPRSFPGVGNDRARIEALEREVKVLKEEIEKLKAALAAPKS